MNDSTKPAPPITMPDGLPQSYWEMEHRRVMQYSDWLCKNFGFSRSGIVQGEVVPVKKLRALVVVDKRP